MQTTQYTSSRRLFNVYTYFIEKITTKSYLYKISIFNRSMYYFFFLSYTYMYIILIFCCVLSLLFLPPFLPLYISSLFFFLSYYCNNFILLVISSCPSLKLVTKFSSIILYILNVFFPIFLLYPLPFFHF